jgi:HJR/Mrr/RecB family endonuclease
MGYIFKEILNDNYDKEDIEDILEEFVFPKSGKKDKLLQTILKNATIFEYAIKQLLDDSSKHEIQIICNSLNIPSNSNRPNLEEKILDKLYENINNRDIENKIKFLNLGCHKYDLENILAEHNISSTGKKEKLIERVARNDSLVKVAMSEWKKELYKEDIEEICDNLGINSEGNREKLLQKVNDYVFKIESKKNIQIKSTINKATSTKHVCKISGENLEKDINKRDWEKMEHLVGKLFESKGYAVTVTQPTGDFGVDVWAKKPDDKIAIQVKHQESDVGYDTIAKTVGATLAKTNHILIVSTKSGFTKQAMAYQMDHSDFLQLWNGKKFNEELQEHLSSNLD